MPQVKALLTVMVQLHPISLLVITSLKTFSPAVLSSHAMLLEFPQRKISCCACSPSPDWFHQKKKKRKKVSKPQAHTLQQICMKTAF